MKQVQKIALLFFNLFFLCAVAQVAEEPKKDNAGYFSLGGRSTLSAFSGEGTGIGTGGSFRIQLAQQVNTEWFADYITINIHDKVRSDYYHIGWSVMFYPIKEPKSVQPYILAGHCFDYNKMTLINSPSITEQRWGSAVQAGLGTHFNITPRFDISLMSQYMIHLSTVLHAEVGDNYTTIITEPSTTLHGHLLTTISLNYKVGKLWNR
jgi:hypothetical protein